MALSEKNIEKVYNGYALAHRELEKLILLMLPFCDSLEKESKLAHDYAFYGVLRRSYNIKRCLANFERISPPERNEDIDDDQRSDLTLFLHAFLLNISGGIDNLAWVWFYVRGIDKIENLRKYRNRIGLFNSDFQKYLDKGILDKCLEFKGWYDLLKKYRDPIAHRIPLYIIPYTVDPKNKEEHNELFIRLSSAKVDEKVNIQRKLDSLRDYEPRYKNSFIEDEGMVRFHPQTIADTKTFCVLAKSVMFCLKSNYGLSGS